MERSPLYHFVCSTCTRERSAHLSREVFKNGSYLLPRGETSFSHISPTSQESTRGSSSFSTASSSSFSSSSSSSLSPSFSLSLSTLFSSSIISSSLNRSLNPLSRSLAPCIPPHTPPSPSPFFFSLSSSLPPVFSSSSSSPCFSIPFFLSSSRSFASHKKKRSSSFSKLSSSSSLSKLSHPSDLRVSAPLASSSRYRRRSRLHRVKESLRKIYFSRVVEKEKAMKLQKSQEKKKEEEKKKDLLLLSHHLQCVPLHERKDLSSQEKLLMALCLHDHQYLHASTALTVEERPSEKDLSSYPKLQGTKHPSSSSSLLPSSEADVLLSSSTSVRSSLRSAKEKEEEKDEKEEEVKEEEEEEGKKALRMKNEEMVQNERRQYKSSTPASVYEKGGVGVYIQQKKNILHKKIWTSLKRKSSHAFHYAMQEFEAAKLPPDEVSFTLHLYGILLSPKHENEKALEVLEQMKVMKVHPTLVRFHERVLTSYLELSKLSAEPHPDNTKKLLRGAWLLASLVRNRRQRWIIRKNEALREQGVPENHLFSLHDLGALWTGSAVDPLLPLPAQFVLLQERLNSVRHDDSSLSSPSALPLAAEVSRHRQLAADTNSEGRHPDDYSSHLISPASSSQFQPSSLLSPESSNRNCRRSLNKKRSSKREENLRDTDEVEEEVLSPPHTSDLELASLAAVVADPRAASHPGAYASAAAAATESLKTHPLFTRSLEGRGLTAQFFSDESLLHNVRREQLKLGGGNGAQPPLEVLPFDDRVLSREDSAYHIPNCVSSLPTLWNNNPGASLAPDDTSFSSLTDEERRLRYDKSSRMMMPTTGRDRRKAARLLRKRQEREERSRNVHGSEREETPYRGTSVDDDVDLFSEHDETMRDCFEQIDNGSEGDGVELKKRTKRESRGRMNDHLKKNDDSKHVSELSGETEFVKEYEEHMPKLFFKKGKIRVVNWRGERKNHNKGEKRNG